MKFVAAILLGLALLAAQAGHGGILILVFSVPAYALALLAGLAAIVPALRAKGAPDLWRVVAGLAAFGYLLWRASWGPDQGFADFDFGIALGCAIVWLSVAGALTGNAERFVFLGVLLAGCLAQAGFAVVQVATEHLSAGGFWLSEPLQRMYEGKFPRRATGLYFNPNHFAWLMNAAVLFCISLGVWGRVRAVVRILVLYFAVVFLALAVLSASRGGLLSLAAGLAAFAVLSLAAGLVFIRHGKAMIVSGSLVLTACAAGAAVFVYSSSWLAQGRVGNTFVLEDVREHLNEQAWRLFQTEPLLGVGPGMFLYAARLYRAGWQASDAVWVHDDWMQLLAEYGFVGFAVVLLAFVVFLAWGLDGFFRPLRLRSASGDRPFSNSAAMALGAWCCLVAFGVHSLLDFNLHLSANALLAAAVLGILASPQMADSRWPGVRWLSRGLVVLALAGAVAGMGMFLWRAAPADYHLLRATNALTHGDVDAARAETEAGLAAAPGNAALLVARARSFAEYESSKQVAAAASEPDVDEQDLIIDEPEAATGEVAAEEAAGFELSEAERRRYQESAAEHFAKAVAGRPMEREYRVLLGRALDELGRKPEARAQFLEAIRLDPVHGFAWGALGDHYYHTDQLVKALEIFTFSSWMPGGNYPAVRAEVVRDELAPESDEDAEAGE